MDFLDDIYSELDITRENGPPVEEACRELMGCLERDHLVFAEYQLNQLEQLQPSVEDLRQYLPEADAEALIGAYAIDSAVAEAELEIDIDDY